MYKKRHIQEHLTEIARFFKIVLITGARQTGKTTLLKNLLPHAPLITLDAHQDIHRAKTSPDNFLASLTRPAIIDEVQFAPALLSSIKRLVDQSSQRGQFFLTGSQNLSLLPQMKESMGGRVGIINLPHLSLQEATDNTTREWLPTYLENPDSIATLASKTIDTISIYDAIWRGNLPESILAPSTVPLPLFFSSYIQTVVDQDIRHVAEIRDWINFRKFLSISASMTAQEVNPTHLGRELGIMNKTAQSWLTLLNASYQWYEHPPFCLNTTKRISKKAKGYFSDTGIACHLLGIGSPQELSNHHHKGALVETWVANNINQQALARPQLTQLAVYHWRSHGGAEVDLIISANGKLYPIEVKSSTHVSTSDTRGIRALKATYPHEKFAHGLVIYTGPTSFRIDEHATALPWNAKLT